MEETHFLMQPSPLSRCLIFPLAMYSQCIRYEPTRVDEVIRCAS